MQVSKQKMALYKAAAERRWQQEQQKLSLSYRQKWQLAEKAAEILKKEFGAQQVAVFGSITQKVLYHFRSDLDIAVWGLDEAKFHRAVAKLLELEPSQRIDLVRIEDVRDSLRFVIEQEGVLI